MKGIPVAVEKNRGFIEIEAKNVNGRVRCTAD